MSEKATLSLVLYANEVLVERSENPILWRRALAEIQSESSSQCGDTVAARNDEMNLGDPSDDGSKDVNAVEPDEIARFANRLGLTRKQIENACSPTKDEPFMRLDEHHWEEMNNQVRGPRIAPTAAVATLLLLWFKEAELGNVTYAQTRAVLSALGINDKNPNRSVKNATWLRLWPSQIVLNPDGISKAKLLARCFSTKDWSAWVESKK